MYDTSNIVDKLEYKELDLLSPEGKQEYEDTRSETEIAFDTYAAKCTFFNEHKFRLIYDKKKDRVYLSNVITVEAEHDNFMFNAQGILQVLQPLNKNRKGTVRTRVTIDIPEFVHYYSLFNSVEMNNTGNYIKFINYNKFMKSHKDKDIALYQKHLIDFKDDCDYYDFNWETYVEAADNEVVINWQHFKGRCLYRLIESLTCNSLVININMSNVTEFKDTFEQIRFRRIKFINAHSNKLKYLHNMFHCCNALTTYNINGLYLKNVEEAVETFCSCKIGRKATQKLPEMPKLRIMDHTFYDFEGKIDISDIKSQAIESIESAFAKHNYMGIDDYNTFKLDFTGWNLSKLVNAKNAFANYCLTDIYFGDNVRFKELYYLKECFDFTPKLRHIYFNSNVLRFDKLTSLRNVFNNSNFKKDTLRCLKIDKNGNKITSPIKEIHIKHLNSIANALSKTTYADEVKVIRLDKIKTSSKYIKGLEKILISKQDLIDIDRLNAYEKELGTTFKPDDDLMNSWSFGGKVIDFNIVNDEVLKNREHYLKIINGKKAKIKMKLPEGVKLTDSQKELMQAIFDVK